MTSWQTSIRDWYRDRSEIKKRKTDGGGDRAAVAVVKKHLSCWYGNDCQRKCLHAMGRYHQTRNLPFPSLTQIYGLMWAIHLPQVSDGEKKKEMKMKKQMRRDGKEDRWRFWRISKCSWKAENIKRQYEHEADLIAITHEIDPGNWKQ